MNTIGLSHLTTSNRRLLDERITALDLAKLDLPIFWRRCSVDILLVTDGLSFSPTADFGLGTFVKILLDTSLWGQVRITLANIGPWTAFHNDPSLLSETRIVRRVDNFRFDNASHFNPAQFDAVFLFGIDDSYPSSIRSGGTLDDSEIDILSAFQNGGGGLFATGDHGKLGFAMCSKVSRARNMRYWDSFPTTDPATDDVSMGGPRRNDTNVFNAGSNFFDDQSDDVPQRITPLLYTRWTGLFRYRYPHPLLCGPNGVIRVMPDHPHEGQCRTPGKLSGTIKVRGADVPEYPPAVPGGTRPIPEIISWNSVAAGRTSGGKSPTTAQSFPGICAYDGHRSRVGRVVTDATWHHFVNVNLIGIDGVEPPDRWAIGFLASAAGQAAFEEIKAYYRNLMLWLSRPATISCLRTGILVTLALKDRVLEAVLTGRSVGLDRLSPRVLSLIGMHARDVLGRYAGRCQSIQIVIDLIEVEWREFIDPWVPIDPDPPVKNPVSDDPDAFPLVDLSPILDAVLGGALVAVSESLAHEDPKKLAKMKPEKIFDIAQKGASVALAKSREALDRTLGQARPFAQGGGKKSK